MIENTLVHAVWDGAVRPCSHAEGKAFDQLFSFFVPVRTALLTIDPGYAQPLAMSEQAALLPGISVGDVLAEELDMDVPFGSIVLIRRQAVWDDPSRAVGYAVGEMLLAMVDRGLVPIDQEDLALLEIAAWYSDLAASDEAAALGLDCAAFRRGLSDMFRDHWSLQDTAHYLFPRSDTARAPMLSPLPKSGGPTAPDRISFDSWSSDLGAKFTRRPITVKDTGGSSRIN